MRFEYLCFATSTSATIPDGLVCRPEVNLRIRGPFGELAVTALLDTGADETILPLSIAECLGVELDPASASQAQGVTGDLLPLLPGKVELELFGDGQIYRWTTLVSFADFPDPGGECVVLGHAGALRYFFAEFDGESRVGCLTANAEYPGVHLFVAE
jgi:hypothetical protein